MRRQLVMLSGGLDSMVLMWEALQNAEDRSKVIGAWVNYGQKNCLREEMAVKILAAEFNFSLAVYEATELFKYNSQSGLLYANYDREADTVESAELRNRNALLANYIAATLQEPTTLLFAAHKTSAPYPDCTSSFYTLLRKLLLLSTNGLVDVGAPYIHKTKQQIVKRAWDLGLTKKDLEMSYSCYYTEECGKCPACKARKEALELFGHFHK